MIIYLAYTSCSCQCIVLWHHVCFLNGLVVNATKYWVTLPYGVRLIFLSSERCGVKVLYFLSQWFNGRRLWATGLNKLSSQCVSRTWYQCWVRVCMDVSNSSNSHGKEMGTTQNIHIFYCIYFIFSRGIGLYKVSTGIHILVSFMLQLYNKIKLLNPVSS